MDIKIVKIDVIKAASCNSSLKIIDLTDEKVRREHIRFGNPADRLARMFKEVLVVGDIDASAVTVIYNGAKSSCPGREPRPAAVRHNWY